MDSFEPVQSLTHAFRTALKRPRDAAGARLATLTAMIAGFALLSGARGFTFVALLTLREPVLGGAGLVLLGFAGWLRWLCAGKRRASRCARRI
ncbi:hypothetical protein [Paraburkholderia sp.]|uniref:hypothetical protein n=1 Tax=Paraburkholderia sp. TaxID=1926495 RepID=UPI00239AF401|nr:hypothetical protein [Paraburkholderia sp.]MDE1179680.1 hypothetical protein [Paraburkholderia sp.]